MVISKPGSGKLITLLNYTFLKLLFLNKKTVSKDLHIRMHEFLIDKTTVRTKAFFFSSFQERLEIR